MIDALHVKTKYDGISISRTSKGNKSQIGSKYRQVYPRDERFLVQKIGRLEKSRVREIVIPQYSK